MIINGKLINIEKVFWCITNMKNIVKMQRLLGVHNIE
jgi:hypothetical protein